MTPALDTNRHQWRPLIVRILLALLVIIATSNAYADTAEAKKHFDRGMKAYNLQDFKGALKEFQSAYVELPDPVFLFNIAQAQRQLGQYEAASKSYHLYLANQPDAPNRDQVLKLIEQTDAAAKEARSKAVPLAPSPPTLTPQTSPTVAQTSVELHASPERSPWYRSTVGWALAGSGLALAAAGAGLLGAVVAEHNASLNATSQPSFDDHHANVVHFQEAGWPLVGVGGALVVAGVTVFALHARSHGR